MIEWIGKNRNSLNLSIVIVVAFFLRLFQLGSQSLWMDEATVYLQTNANSIYEVYSNIMNQEGHIGPFYHILNYLFTLLFGYSESSLRMPSVIYGTISVMFVYKIAQALTNNHVALLSSILMALSPVHVWYSQEARMYSLWLMLIAITTFLFIKTLEKGKLWLWILLTVFSSLSIWTFLNSIFILFAFGLYLVIFIKRYKRELCLYIVSALVAVLTYLPGIMALMAKGPATALSKVGSARSTSILDLAYAFYVFNVGTTLGPSLVTIRALLKQSGLTDAAQKLIVQYGVLIIPAIVLFGFIFIYGSVKAMTKRKDSHYAFILVMLFVPTATIFGITFFSKSLPFNIRYIFCILPFYLILLSVAIHGLSTTKKWLLFSGVLFFSAFSLYNHYFNSEYAKLDFRSVVQYLNETMNDKDNAIIVHEGAQQILRYYDKSDRLPQYHIPIWNSLERATSIMKQSRKIYYVKSIRIQTYKEKEINRIEELLDENFNLIDSIDPALHIQIKIYERPNDLTLKQHLPFFNPSRQPHKSTLL